MKTVASAAVVGTVVSAVISDYQSGRSKLQDAYYAQDKDTKTSQLEIIKKLFGEDDDAIIKASKNYVDDIIAQKTTPKSRKKAADDLVSEISKRVRQTQNLRTFFPSAEIQSEIESYQTALLDFSGSIEGFRTALQMRDWSEKFARLMKAQDALRDKLKSVANARPQAPKATVGLF